MIFINRRFKANWFILRKKFAFSNGELFVDFQSGTRIISIQDDQQENKSRVLPHFCFIESSVLA
jgi:hypothetical protein